MTVNCESCEKQLEITPFGYMHPIGGTCTEDDGLRVESTARYIFENKYGKPVRTQEHTINLLKTELKEKQLTIELLDKQHKNMKEINGRLNEWEITNKKNQIKLVEQLKEALKKKKSFWHLEKNR